MYLSLLLLRCRGQWKWRISEEKNGTKLSAGNPSQWCQRSELLEGREDTSGEFCCVEVVWWNPHQNWDHLLQILPSQHKVDLSRSPCVYLTTSLVQHSIWQLHKRIASQWISVNVGESKGGFVSWGRCGYPLSSEDVRQISASEEKSVPWSPQQFVGKVLLNSESSGGGTGLCCLFFLTCEPSHTYQGNDLLTPGIGAVGFALPAGVKFRQGDFFSFEMNPGLTAAHSAVSGDVHFWDGSHFSKGCRGMWWDLSFSSLLVRCISKNCYFRVGRGGGSAQGGTPNQE